MRHTLFVLPLLAATAVFGQHTTLAANAPVTKHVVALGDCPVGMTARRQGFGQTIWTIALEDQGKPQNKTAAGTSRAGVHVELNASNGAAIRQVELTVHYTPVGNRALLIAQTGDPADLEKTFHLSAENGASLKLVGDLLVGHAASITRVVLHSIEYTNGTTWHASSGNACSVEPNGLLLVGAR